MALSVISEQKFISRVESQTYNKFHDFVAELRMRWVIAMETSDYKQFLGHLYRTANRLDKELTAQGDNWGLQKIAVSVDTDWAENESWISYERYFRYSIRHLVQEIFGEAITLSLHADWAKPSRALFESLTGSIESQIKHIEGLIRGLHDQKTAKIQPISTTLTASEWDRLLALQDERWRYFGPIGKIGAPLYWPAVRVGTLAVTPLLDSAELLKAAGVGNKSRVLDLGTGFGDPCVVAAIVFGANASGYEIHPVSADIAQGWISHLEGASLLAKGQVEITQADYRGDRLHGFTHFFAFPASERHYLEIENWLSDATPDNGLKFAVYDKANYMQSSKDTLPFARLRTNNHWRFIDLPQLRSFILEYNVNVSTSTPLKSKACLNISSRDSL